MRISRLIGISLAVLAAVVTLYVAMGTKSVENPQIFEFVMENYSKDTNAQNSVASIYLNYRIFDTIFEALMLLVSVMGVIHFSRHEHEILPEEIHVDVKKSIKDKSKNSIAVVVPIIIMLGLYLIINGHNTPGGGFQGGAALSSAFICVFLIRPDKIFNFYAYEKMEKFLFLLIATTAVFFAVSNLFYSFVEYNIAYLIIMNFLIGLKVFCGLSIVFYRFVHYEDA